MAIPLSSVHKWTAEKTGLGSSLNARSLEIWQMDKLRAQLNYARDNSPYYRERLKDIDFSKITRKRDLSLLPLTPAKAIRDDSKAFLCVSGSKTARIATLNTSGTAGDVKRIYFSENDLARTVEFFSWGMETLVRPGQTALICLSDETPDGLGTLLKKAIENIGVSASIHGPIKDIEMTAQAAIHVNCIIGLPAQLNRLCLTNPGLRPDSVLLTADYVPSAIVRNLQNIWGSLVLTHYGMTESGFGLAVQCVAEEAHHVRDAEYITEIVNPDNGGQVKDEEWGELAITSLFNEAMPLIRYRTGDITRLIVSDCRCGGNLPRLDKVKGRYLNIKEAYPIHSLDEALFRLPGLLDYRAYISQSNKLELELDSQAIYKEDDIRAVLMKELIEPRRLNITYKSLPVYAGAVKRSVINSLPIHD